MNDGHDPSSNPSDILKTWKKKSTPQLNFCTLHSSNLRRNKKHLDKDKPSFFDFGGCKRANDFCTKEISSFQKKKINYNQQQLHRLVMLCFRKQRKRRKDLSEVDTWKSSALSVASKYFQTEEQQKQKQLKKTSQQHLQRQPTNHRQYKRRRLFCCLWRR